ncbi:MAG: LuxR C-terminal-related transcriptional regulator [Paracoccaceae bacterium]|jgi:DNA-binding CsgD family transcriptional regulator|nr:LuxR C-terminal-related transcriptional regulator [Paracoccaceae bacterium]
MELERIAFEHAPIGLALTENRIMKQVNMMFAEMFSERVDYFADRSLRELYPTQDDFDRIAVVGVESMRESGRYDDERVMQRLNGDQFWCRVRGQSLTPDDPFQWAIWSFSDLSEMRPVVQMTNREKDVAALTCKGLSSKEIGRELGLSHRTVEIYRARLMKKFEARKTAELVSKLSGMPI